MKRVFEVLVIGKYIKKRWIFSDKPMISVEFTNKMKPQYADFPLSSMAEYFTYEIGSIIGLTMYQHSDGLWRHYPESD